MYSIEKKFTFQYAHRLHLMPEGHGCRNNHGHSGVVTIEINSIGLDSYGFIIDFGELRFIQSWIDANWDHATLVSENDPLYQEVCVILNSKHWVLPKKYKQTTSEYLAEYLHSHIKSNLILASPKPRKNDYKLKVSFSETANNTASYEE